MKKNNGITLIALVVTIIVLLILAGVSISMVSGDNGIATKAQKAKEETRKQSAYESINLVIGEWPLAELSGEKTLEEYLNSKVTVGALDSVTKDEEKQVFILEKDGYTKTLDMVTEPKIGDYVNYTPAGTAYTTSYNVEAVYSGESTDQIVYQQETRWRILSIDDGKLVLISEKNLGIGNVSGNTTKLSLKGADGYNNGVDLLNIACQTLYSNSSVGAVARSIRQSDIDKYSTYDKNDFSAGGGAYGDVFSADGNNVPRLYLAEIGCDGNTTGYDVNDMVGLGTYSGFESKTLEAKLTGYIYNFENYCDDEVYKELLKGNSMYWAATRNVIADNDTGTPSKGYWLYFSIGRGGLFDDLYGPCSQSLYLKPIVEISGASLTRDVENSTAEFNCWDL